MRAERTSAAGAILQVCRIGFIGGAERVALACAEVALESARPSIMVCPPDGPLAAEAMARGVAFRAAPIARGSPEGSLLQLPGIALQMQRARRAVAQIAQDAKAGVVHVHHPVGAFQAAYAASQVGAPLVLHVHETLPAPPQYALFGPWLRRRVERFICVSRKGVELVKSLGVRDERIQLIYNAVEPRYFATPVPAAEITGPGPHIGIFGTLEPRKGHADLLQACARLRTNFPDLEIWIVGGQSSHNDAANLNGLRSLADQLGLSHRTHFTGLRQDIPQLMAAMDVVVSASLGPESLPTVLIEGGALGRPVVGTSIGGVGEIISEGVTGFLAPSAAPEALAQAIARALSPAGPRVAAEAARQARQRFSPERFRAELLNAYDQVLQQRPPIAA